MARLEMEEGAPRRRTLSAIRAALEAAGVEFTDGNAPGVRLRKRPRPPKPEAKPRKKPEAGT